MIFKLRIIVNNYNNGKFLKECLQSLQAQKTNFKFIILIVDDYSNDNSKEVFCKIKKECQNYKIRFFQAKKNYGNQKKTKFSLYSKLRKYLFTDYYMRVDSDDYFIDNLKLQKQIDFLDENKEFIGCGTNFLIKDEINSKTSKSDIFEGSYNLNDYIKNIVYKKYNYWTHTSTMIFRNIHKGNFFFKERNNILSSGDTMYNVHALNYGKIYNFSNITTTYRVHANGVWSKKNIKAKERKNKFINLKIFILSKINVKIIWIIYFFKSKINNFFKK